MTSAAGKCLRKMDLPLARREPSPPYRLREAMCLARRCPIGLPKPCPADSLQAEATRARFQFVGHTHRKRIHLKRGGKIASTRSQAANRKQLLGAIALPFGGCRCSDKPGAFQCQEKNGLGGDFFEIFCRVAWFAVPKTGFAYFLAAKTMSRGSLEWRRQSSM